MNTFFICEQKLGNTIFTFSQKAKVLSTSPLNGGLTRHLSHAVNINCMNGSYECKMLGDTYEKDLAAHVHALRLSPFCVSFNSCTLFARTRLCISSAFLQRRSCISFLTYFILASVNDLYKTLFPRITSGVLLFTPFTATWSQCIPHQLR